MSSSSHNSSFHYFSNFPQECECSNGASSSISLSQELHRDGEVEYSKAVYLEREISGLFLFCFQGGWF